MFGFDKLFDYNRDGRLDASERALQLQFLDEMMLEDDEDSYDEDEETDSFDDI